MSSSLNFKILPFTIKLKYNVGESKQTQYLDIEKFSYETIKNAEMVEKQKEKYIKSKEKDYEISLNEYYQIHKGKKQRATLKTEFDSSHKGIAAIKQKQWTRDNDHFDGLHDYIYNKKKNDIPFKIVRCPFYYEYDSLLYHIDDNSDSNENIDIDSIEYCNQEMEIIKDNKIIKDKIGNWIKELKDDNNPTDERITWKNLFFLKQDEDPDFKIAIDNKFTELGFLNEDKEKNDKAFAREQKIKRNKLAYLLFETNLQPLIEQYGLDAVDFNDNSAMHVLFSSDSYGNKNTEETFEKTQDIYSFKSIDNFKSVDKIHMIIKNIIYLKKNNLFKVKKPDGKASILFKNIFNLTILENKAIYASKIIFNNFDKEIKNYKDIRNLYKNNINEFFIENTNDNNNMHLMHYFTFLKNNYLENVKMDALPTSTRFQSNTRPWNTDKKRKAIVKDYAKYILEPDELEISEGKNEDELYNRLKADKTKLTNIITYYNLHKILETLYLTKGTILKVPLFELIDNKVQEPEPKPNNETYIKILEINPIKLSVDQKRRAFDNDKLEAIFEIKFEKIYTYSTIQFYLNIIDINNPDTLLTNLLNNEQKIFENNKKAKERKLNNIKKIENKTDDEIKEEKLLEKEVKEVKEKTVEVDITKLNNTYGIYNIYGNKIFPKIESNNKIFIEPTFDYDKLFNNFNILKKNIIKKYEKDNIESLREIFLNSKLFDYIYKEGKYNRKKGNVSEDDNYITKIIINYYLNKFFFKNKTNLNIGNKIAEIIDVQIRIIGDIPVEYQKNIKNENLIDKCIKRNHKLFLKERSKKTRLALDNKDNIYNVFLDVSVFYKDKISDKVPLSLRVKTGSNCIQTANTLDKIMYDYLSDLYPKNLLENKIRNKESSNLENKPEIQKGGKNRVTKKNINKRRHNTLKNLVTYYAI